MVNNTTALEDDVTVKADSSATSQIWETYRKNHLEMLLSILALLAADVEVNCAECTVVVGD